ncbi:hypothetical protein MJO29_010334 [Puccinia striiformis f. sp. tritici]|nr:hypothetical protein Pst134EA_019411 [Puccinia striiformis f. sp. tritici]POW01756.1 hypothetical protein PSTT_12249 [Puccinia striiformis]KAH9449474.1 hypothetical protein Pst134EB_020300 [Puccinia striiformis f. sp. tritici]KAH9459258.1 hypothetical protein Pst134EA_019411 [Puccinia striiformis f. sp. tritici]KAI7948669.1 hypothetical protein MJO29_010334 [Puccinia striiformis f. sp. tritici]POW09165.1 hypothetical protein PSHT_09234 [Puccinia striiformis]
MFSSGPSLELMTAKFGSPVSQPSPTNTCSSTVNDSGHAATSHDKTALNFSRRALYPMSYEEAAINLHQVQCTALSLGRPSVVLPGPEGMLNGAPAYQAAASLPRSSLSPIEQTHPPLPHRRRGRRHLTNESRTGSANVPNHNLQSPRQRVSIACTFCRARKLRCTPGPPPCEHCKRRSHPCKFDYQTQHRDQLPPAGPSSSSTDLATHQ